jgi:hypothetical protein
MARHENGGLIGIPSTPTTSAATGKWSLFEAAKWQKAGVWPAYLQPDPYFNLTTLLLHGDGTNGAQNNTFLDSSSNNFSITRNGNTTQGTFTPFSQTGWSNYFNGGSDGLYLPNNTATVLGSGNFTAEAWIYPTATISSTQMVMGSWDGASTVSWQIELVSTNKIGFAFSTAGTYQAGNEVITSTSVIVPNTWQHVAVVRNGATITLYLNGVSQATLNASTNTFYSAPNNTKVGTNTNSQSFVGYVSNARLVVGTAVYTANFTPSTSPLSAISGTQLLTCQSNRFLDGSSNAFAITTTGSPSVQAFSPFNPTIPYNAATVGGSGYFDGFGDYLTGSVPLSSSTSMSTFTIEGWIYPTTFANTIHLIGDMSPTGDTNVLSVRVGTNGDAVLYWYDGAVKNCTSTTFMKLNQWNWFAIVVNNNAISIYVNSTTSGQAGNTTLTNRTQTSNFTVGQYYNSTTPAAYVGSLRWSNGIARTISSIPTAPYTSDADTKLLLNFTNAGIFDQTAKNDLETVGNAQISTSVKKFGTGSLAFDGNGDYLVTPFTQLFNMWQGDSTVETWVYFNSLANSPHIYVIGEAEPFRVTLYVSGSVLRFYTQITTGADRIVSGTTLVTGRWYHVAVTKNAGTWTLWLDGVSQGTSTTTVYPAGPAEQLGIGYLQFGTGTNNAFNGYMDDFRITRGYARYTANFTPPTDAFPNQ